MKIALIDDVTLTEAQAARLKGVKKTEICIDNIEAFIAGRPQHVVNPAVFEPGRRR